MFLNEGGLSRLWQRICDYVSSRLDEYDELAVATIHEKGQVRPDGTTITVDDDGTIHGIDTNPSNIIYAGNAYPSQTPMNGQYYYYVNTQDIELKNGTALIVKFLGRLPDVYSTVYIRINNGDVAYPLHYYNHESVRWPIITLGMPTLIVYDGGFWIVVGEFDNPANKVITGVSDTQADIGEKRVDVYVTDIRAGIIMILTLKNTNTAPLQSLAISINGYGYPSYSTYASIRKNGQELTENLVADVQYVLRFDGTYWQLIGKIDDIHTATTSTVGTVKPDGTTITIDNDGTLHGVEQTPIATSSVAGKVKPDGTTITIDADGTIHGIEHPARLSELENDVGYISLSDITENDVMNMTPYGDIIPNTDKRGY